ncbi:MAG: NADH-quinone oxidoreductase subunit NuoN [Magnetospiraceae bacterium]
MPLAEVPNIVPALPELFLAIVSMVMLIMGTFQKQKDGALGVAMVGTISLILAMVLVAFFGFKEAETFNGMFVTNNFIGYAKLLVLTASTLALYLAFGDLRAAGNERYEYSVLIVLATLGMMLMVSADDLIALYMGLELQSLSLYVLAAHQRDVLRSSEAGVKYFVLGALASGMLLYGASLVYGFTGTTSFDTLAEQFSHGHVQTGVIVGLVFMIVGLAFKVSAVPFHMWTPDVYEGAPTPVTAFFAVAPKMAAITLFVRVLMDPFGPLVGEWQQVVIVISGASMVLGAFAAIAQRNIKRLMAYSSIGHVGYALIGLATGTVGGVRGIMVYMAIYIFMNLGAFACIIAMRRGGKPVEQIDDLAGLSKNQPLMAAAMAAFMFSMAGIPPLAGFFGKLYVFISAIEAGLYGLAVIGVLSSVVGAFYYMRIIKIMYFDEPADAFDRPMAPEVQLVLIAAAAVVLLFFAYPDPILNGAAVAAQTLVAK